MNDLDKSIKILEDALSTPGKKMVRSSRFLAKVPRQSLSHQSVLSESKFDREFAAAPHEYQEIMGDSRLLRERTLTESMFDGNTTLNFALKSAEILDKLFIDFFQFTQMHESAHQVFQTIAEYIQVCTDNLELAIEIQSKALGETKESAVKQQAWLENERNIWRLIYCLYQDRLTAEKDPQIEMIPPNIMTEVQCVENLYRTNSLIRECQLVVDWLERNTADQQYGIPRMGHFTDKTVGWENTLHQLTESTIVFPSTRPVVTNLDPDAIYREDLPLHDLDIEDDKRLCHQIFYEIRCGRMDEAQALCVHCGHPWRAALLDGWRLFHDPNFGKVGNHAIKEPTEGNPNRDLWKFRAYTLCDEPKLDPFWRATLAVLCGNLKAILPICDSWEDYLWAYLKVMIDIRVESEIRDTLLKKYYPMPDEYFRNQYSLNEIFNKLPEGEKNAYEHSICRHLIMDEPEELFKAMKEWTQSDQSETVRMKKMDIWPQFLRLLAHIVLMFREFGITGNETAGDSVLEAYVQVLIDLEKKDIIAFYTAKLPQSLQIAMYSTFLETITDPAEKREMLCNAEEAGLDVEAITKQLVETIRKRDIYTVSTDLTSETTENDLVKISALEWLTFYETQRLEAIYQTNALIRYFLASGKLDAARQAFNQVSVDTVDHILSNYDENSVPVNVQNIVKEFLCYKAYLDGNECFSDWFHHFHNGKPKEPAPIPPKAGYAERVAYEHRVSLYNGELDRWKLTMSHRTKNTKTILYNILLFPDGGWLVDPDETDECRATQLKELRTVCLPKVVLLLHTVMHRMGEYKECIQLADLLADETTQLYRVFNKHALGDILQKIAESSLALTEQKKDPWGYETGT